MFGFLNLRSIGFKLSFFVVTIMLSMCSATFYLYFANLQSQLIDNNQEELQTVAEKQAILLNHELAFIKQNIDDLASLVGSQISVLPAGQMWQNIQPALNQNALVNYYVDAEQLLASPISWQKLTTESADINHLVFYQEIFEADTTEGKWTSIYSDDVLGKWVMGYGRAIYHDGKTVGVLGSIIEVDPLIRSVTQLANDNGIEVFIYNLNGSIVYHPDYGSTLIRQVDVMGNGLISGNYIRDSLADFIVNNKVDGTVLTFQDWGKPVYASSRNIETNDWVLVAYQRRSDMLKVSWQYFIPAISALLIIVTFSWFLLLIFNRIYISNRLLKTANILTRAGAGHIKVLEEVKGYDEIDEVNRHINKLFKRFQAKLEDKDKTIAEMKTQADSNKALAQATSFSDSAVIFLELDFMISFVDSKCLSLLKCQRDDIMGTRFFSYIHEHMAFISEQIVNEIRRKQSWRGELVLKNQDSGEQVWINATITPMRDDASNVTKYVVSMQDISFIKDSQNRIEKLAYTDELTNLANRTFFVAQLEKLVGISKRGRYDFALLYFDLDDFKRVNDQFGHEGGDQMLRELSVRLSEHLRNEDVLARMGGDEFALILGGASSEQDTLVMANHILEIVSQPFLIKDQEIQSSTSIGITMSNTDEAEPELLLQHADLAMYAAKSLGKNTYHFYTKELNEAAKERQEIETALQLAIKNNDLQLYFQPKVNFKQQKLVGFEALCRWHDPVLGVISPAKFIPIAEQSNLILQLSSWVMEHAVKFAATLTDPVPVSINISARQFEAGSYVTELETLISKYYVSPEMIELELTESLLVVDVEDAIHQLTELKQLGVMLSIDDFGTGYSSLSYLKRFPVDTLKIDRSFIKDIPDDVNDVEITGAIIAMAQKLGLSVIAEGAETEAQIEFLGENGCYIVQGYYFSKPLMADEARQWNFVSETKEIA